MPYQNKLNEYIFVIRIEGVIDYNNADSIKQTQITSLYLINMGIKIIGIMHNNMDTHIKNMCAAFGINPTHGKNLYICSNNEDDILKTLQNITRSGYPVSSTSKYIYLDNFNRYVSYAKSVGMRGYRIDKYIPEQMNMICKDLLVKK